MAWDKTDYFRDYISLLFDHGINPVNAEYAYVILPGRTRREVEAFAVTPAVEILENSVQAHAVRHHGLNLTGANFWEDSVKSAGGITCDRKASVIVMRTGDFIELSVSDPTHKNNGFISVELNVSAKYMIKADPGVKVESLSPCIKVKINVKGLKGASARVILH